jgi:hypothetical protein
VLETHRDRLEALAQKLIAQESVDGEDFEALFAGLPPKENLHGLGPRRHEPPATPTAPADAAPKPDVPPSSAPAPNPA